jgi:hypothetical protein
MSGSIAGYINMVLYINLVLAPVPLIFMPRVPKNAFWSRIGHEPGWTLGKCLTRNGLDMVTNRLAKVGVEASNPFARFNYFNGLRDSSLGHPMA